MVLKLFGFIQWMRALRLTSARRAVIVMVYLLLAALLVIYVLTVGIVLALILVVGNLLLPPLDTMLKRDNLARGPPDNEP